MSLPEHPYTITGYEVNDDSVVMSVKMSLNDQTIQIKIIHPDGKNPFDYRRPSSLTVVDRVSGEICLLPDYTREGILIAIGAGMYPMYRSTEQWEYDRYCTTVSESKTNCNSIFYRAVVAKVSDQIKSTDDGEWSNMTASPETSTRWLYSVFLIVLDFS